MNGLRNRKTNGLTKALEIALKRLHKEEGISYKVEKLDKKKGINVNVNNPELMKRLKELAEGYRKKK